MFFVWTSEGGPLQYAGLGLFLLQMIPRLFPDLTAVGLLTVILPVAVLVVTFQTWQTGAGQVRDVLQRWRNEGRQSLQQRTGIPWSNLGFSALVGVSTACLISLVLTMNLQALSFLSQFLAIGVVAYTHLNGPLQEHNQEHRRRQAKMEELFTIVQSMPVEEFVSEEELEGIPISQLKEMLLRRGLSKEELGSFVDRHNMMEALHKRRKYCDTCCICFESYEKEEPLRILPKCGHEIHIECLDKWVYTFVSRSKQDQSPSCPLCKICFK